MSVAVAASETVASAAATLTRALCSGAAMGAAARVLARAHAQLQEMHASSGSRAVSYVIVVLLLYAFALIVALIKYVRQERYEARLYHIYDEFMRRDRFLRLSKHQQQQPQRQQQQQQHSSAGISGVTSTVTQSDEPAARLCSPSSSTAALRQATSCSVAPVATGHLKRVLDASPADAGDAAASLTHPGQATATAVTVCPSGSGCENDGGKDGGGGGGGCGARARANVPLRVFVTAQAPVAGHSGGVDDQDDDDDDNVEQINVNDVDGRRRARLPRSTATHVSRTRDDATCRAPTLASGACVSLASAGRVLRVPEIQLSVERALRPRPLHPLSDDDEGGSSSDTDCEPDAPADELLQVVRYARGQPGRQIGPLDSTV